jgi:uncharacterized membrane protein YphA (DoxX/SURF4 family)
MKTSTSNPPGRPSGFRISDFGFPLLRWGLGLLFIYLGVSKVLHPAEFLKFVQEQLRMTNPSWSSVFVAAAPWLEVFYGLLLLSGIAREAAALVARWWLACVFIFMGLNKALPHPEYFLKLVRAYQMVDTPWLLNSIGATLPWFEVFCGLLLLFGIAVRGSALMLIAMLVPFTAVVFNRALGIAAGSHIPFCAVKFDCGCGMGEVFICHKLVENTVLFLLSAWLLAGGGRRFCLCFSLFREKQRAPQQTEPVMPAAV